MGCGASSSARTVEPAAASGQKRSEDLKEEIKELVSSTSNVDHVVSENKISENSREESSKK